MSIPHNTSRQENNSDSPSKSGKRIKPKAERKKPKLLRVPFTQEEYELYRKLTPDRMFAHFFANVEFGISILEEVLDQETLDEIDLSGLTIAPTERLDENMNKYFLDMLYEVPLRDGTGFQNFYTVFEHKSYPDHWALYQTFEYSCRILNNSRKISSGELPAVAAIIVHQGPLPYSGPTNLRDYFPKTKGLRRFAIEYEGLILDTSAKSGRTFKFDPNVPHKDLVLKMMRAVSSEDKLPAARQFLEELNQREPDENLVRLRRMFIVSLDKIAKLDITDIRELEKNTQPPKVEEMSTLDELMQRASEESLARGLATGLATGREEGMATGLATGLATGRKEGREEGARKSLLVLLKKKFKRIPRRIESQINDMRDFTAIQSLIVAAGMSDTLAEFEENL